MRTSYTRITLNNHSGLFCLSLLAAILIYAPTLFPSLSMAQPLQWYDSAQSTYTAASHNYDRVALQKIAELVNRQSEEDRRSAKTQLLLGLIYWRLELFAYCTDDDAQVKRFGQMAIEAFTSAEEAKEDIYITASHKALACQLLASVGMTKAIKYGPRAAEELKKAQKAKSARLLFPAGGSDQCVPGAFIRGRESEKKPPSSLKKWQRISPIPRM